MKRLVHLAQLGIAAAAISALFLSAPSAFAATKHASGASKSRATSSAAKNTKTSGASKSKATSSSAKNRSKSKR